MMGSEQSVGSAVISMGGNVIILHENEVEISWLSITVCRPPTQFAVDHFNTMLMTNCITTNCSGTYYFRGTEEVTGKVAIENTTMITNTVFQPLFRLISIALEFSRNRILNNNLIQSAVVLLIYDSESVFRDNMFTENSGDSCGPIAVLVIDSTIKLQEANRFMQSVGNGIASSASQITFEGLTTFDANDACYGPITSLDSTLNISGSIVFIQNNIQIFGGAMFLSADG